MKWIIAFLLVFCFIISGLTIICGDENIFDNNDLSNFTRAGSVLFVGGVSAGNYTTIQSAVDAASSGDTIRVYDGTFLGNVYLNKTINLIGNGTECSYIRGPSNNDVVIVNADSCLIQDLTMTDGSIGSMYIGVKLVSNNNIVRNCVFRNSSNHGIYIDNPYKNNLIDNCFSKDNYYGANLNTASDNIFNNCNFEGNYYGIKATKSHNTVINGSTFEYNFGGVIFSNSNAVNLRNIQFNTHCSIQNGPNSKVDNCTFNNSGFGINTNSDSVYIRNNIFNRSMFSLTKSMNTVMYNNNFTGKSIWIQDDTLGNWISHTIPTNNTVNGKPIYYKKQQTGGSIPSDAGEVILADCDGVSVKGIDFIDNSVAIELGFSTNCVIEKCNFTNSSWYSVYLRQSNTNNIVKDCNFSLGRGAYYYSSSNNIIKGSKFDISNPCVQLSNSDSVSLEYIDSTDSYISASGCDDLDILNFNFTGKYYSNWAMTLNSVTNSRIKNNKIEDSYGIYFKSSSNNVVENNNLSLAGFYFQDYSSTGFTVTNNIVNNKPYYYRVGTNDLNIPSDVGQVFLSNCNNFKLADTQLSNTYQGIVAYQCDGGSLKNVTCNNNYHYGSDVYKSDNVKIENSTFHNNIGNGIRFGLCNEGEIYNSTFINNSIGNTNGAGLYTSGTNVNVKYNNFIRNGGYGSVYGSGSGFYHLNNYVENYHSINQSLDQSANVVWDNGTTGNYWSSHTSPDIDSDGIVDNPYLPNTTVGVAVDSYPLTIPYGLPEIIDNINRTIIEKIQYSQDLIAFDNNTPLEKLTWTMNTNASWLNLNKSHILGIANSSHDGNYFLNVSLSDGIFSTYLNTTITVLNINNPPTITTPNEMYCWDDSSYLVDYNATDPDSLNEDLTWFLSTNATFLSINSTSGILSGTPTNSDVGSYWVNISVTDGKEGLDFTNFTLVVFNTNQNLSIITSNIVICYEDQSYSSDYNAVDIDPTNDIFTWRLNTNATFLSINSTSGLLSGVPSNEDVGTYWVYVNASDGNGGYDDRNFTLTVLNTNDAPNITTAHILTTFEDALYSVDYDAIDIDPTNDILQWSLPVKPSFVDIDSLTGIVTGTPGNSDVGQHSISVMVSDGNGGVDYSNFTLTVTNTNDDPVIITNDLLLIQEDEFYLNDYEAVDIDPTNDVLSWSLNTNATFLNLNSTDGNLNGNPDNSDVGSYWVNISVGDGNGGFDWANFTLFVNNTNDKPFNPNITIEGSDLIEGQPFKVIGKAIDIDVGDQLRYHWFLNGSFIEEGKSIELNLTAGTYVLKLVATDSFGDSCETTHTIEITKEENQTITPDDDDDISPPDDDIIDDDIEPVDDDIVTPPDDDIEPNVTADDDDDSTEQSFLESNGLYILLGLIVFIAIGIIIFFMMKKKGDLPESSEDDDLEEEDTDEDNNEDDEPDIEDEDLVGDELDENEDLDDEEDLESETDLEDDTGEEDIDIEGEDSISEDPPTDDLEEEAEE